jgi:hypothetical protein
MKGKTELEARDKTMESMMMKTMKMMPMTILLNLEMMKERRRMSSKTKEVRRQRSMKSEK